MPSNVFRFDERWDFPGAKITDVYHVLSHGELLPKWWKGVYLEAVPMQQGTEPKVGDRFRRQSNHH